jgi:hypothetical protein
MWKEIGLWLFVINLGVAFGAGIYESRVVIPQWVRYSPARMAKYRTAARDRDNRRDSTPLARRRAVSRCAQPISIATRDMFSIANTGCKSARSCDCMSVRSGHAICLFTTEGSRINRPEDTLHG